MEYIPRELRGALNEACRNFPALLITGPRQSGKTTFVRHELAAVSEYISFDDSLARQFAQDDPNGFLDQFADRPVILDEIQYVPGLMTHIKICIDRRGRNGQWVMTGSQQFELMRNVSESLAGRVAILELLPFAYPEIQQTRRWSIRGLHSAESVAEVRLL